MPDSSAKKGDKLTAHADESNLSTSEKLEKLPLGKRLPSEGDGTVVFASLPSPTLSPRTLSSQITGDSDRLSSLEDSLYQLIQAVNNLKAENDDLKGRVRILEQNNTLLQIQSTSYHRSFSTGVIEKTPLFTVPEQQEKRSNKRGIGASSQEIKNTNGNEEKKKDIHHTPSETNITKKNDVNEKQIDTEKYYDPLVHLKPFLDLNRKTVKPQERSTPLKPYAQEQLIVEHQISDIEARINALDSSQTYFGINYFFTDRKIIKSKFLVGLKGKLEELAKSKSDAYMVKRYEMKKNVSKSAPQFAESTDALNNNEIEYKIKKEIKVIVNQLVADSINNNTWDMVKAGRSSQTLALLVKLGYDQKVVDQLLVNQKTPMVANNR